MVLAVSQRMLSAESAEDASVSTGAPFEHAGCVETTHYVEWGDGVASGVVAIEAADGAEYAGTWQRLATVTFTGTAPKVESVRIAGVHRTIRHRVASIVIDGTVTTKLQGVA